MITHGVQAVKFAVQVEHCNKSIVNSGLDLHIFKTGREKKTRITAVYVSTSTTTESRT